jgi:flagellar motor switch/type III secretory pathway protein FliN
MYDSAKGWTQIGKDLPVKFSVGDQFTVRTLADGRVEILRNGKLVAKTDVTP